MRLPRFSVLLFCGALLACNKHRGGAVDQTQQHAREASRSPATAPPELPAHVPSGQTASSAGLPDEQAHLPAGTREPTLEQAREPSGSTATPAGSNLGPGDVEQGTSVGDRAMTQRIRRALLRDEVLSFTAKNILIITRDGNVTLRGYVLSEKERSLVDELVRSYVGDGSVTDLLQLKDQP